MKRLLVLFLICVLSLQVFAGMVSLRAIESQQMPLSLQMSPVDIDHERLIQDGSNQHGDHKTQGASGDDAGIADADNEDFTHHAGIGDEPVLVMARLCAADSARLAPALRSDPAIQPPFLPPAGRPPQA